MRIDLGAAVVDRICGTFTRICEGFGNIHDRVIDLSSIKTTQVPIESNRNIHFSKIWMLKLLEPLYFPLDIKRLVLQIKKI